MADDYFIQNITNSTSMEFSPLGIQFSIAIIGVIFLFFMIPYLYELKRSYGATEQRNNIISGLIDKIKISSEIYVDTSKGFHFDGPDKDTNVAHNIMEFSLLLSSVSEDNLRYFLLKKDFSRWVKEVLKNDLLAKEIERIETSENLDELRRAIKKWVNEHESSYSLILSTIDLMKQPVEGISGFTRGMISLGIIFILGIAIVMIFVALQGDSQLANTVMSMMGTTLAAVVGFYFGGKSAENIK